MLDKKVYSVAIIGGGFSALVIANSLKLNNEDVVILERLDRLGKKILSTGNGRGNVTNANLSVENYHGQNPSFVQHAITRYDNQSMRAFFADLGIMLTQEDGKVYPASLQANSVLDALRFGLEKTSVQVMLGFEVIKIDFNERQGVYALKSETQTVYAKTVVFAFGGASQKQFGTDGKAFNLAKSLGHTITKLNPSLVQMRASNSLIKGLRGVKSYVRLSLFDGDRQVKSTLGDLLFTDSGISGNTTFYLSAYLSGLKKPVVCCEFMPDITKNRLIDHLLYKCIQFPSLDCAELLNGVVHKALAKNIVKSITDKRVLSALTRQDVERVCNVVKGMEIEINGTLGFDYSQVTNGGILTSEVSQTTFESKLAPSVYIVGEALDVDGDCGGYNLQWAYSSARVVAEVLNAKS